MFRTGFFFRFLAALLLIGALIAGGVLIFQSGQAQGYALGTAAAASGSTTAPNQTVPYYPMTPWGWSGYYGPHFFMFAPLFFCGAIFFFFFIVGGLFRFGHHYRHDDAEHAHWVKHTHPASGPEQVSDQPRPPANSSE